MSNNTPELSDVLLYDPGYLNPELPTGFWFCADPTAAPASGETRSYGMIWTASAANCARAKPAASGVPRPRQHIMPVSACAPRPRPPGSYNEKRMRL